MATPNFSNITEAKVSGVRPTNFIDKKKAFAGYEKAKQDNYSGDFVDFVTNLEKKGYAVEESTQIKNTKAAQQYQEQKRVEAQKAVARKIPITEATGSEIWNDLIDDLGEGAKTFLAPSAGMLQGLADIGQGVVGKPIEFLTKKMLGAFGYSDESLESITTQSDIARGLNKEGAKIGREVGKIAGSMALTPGGSVGSIAKGLKGIPYMQEVAKRIAIGVGEGLVGNASYNVATTDTLGSPVNLGVGAGIGGAFRALPIIGNAMSPLRDKLASKLQLSGLMTRTKLENLQNILRQGGAEDLAQGTPEDVAEWMFQRGLEGNKKTIMTKLDDIADASMDMVDRKLTKIQGVHDTGTLDDILVMLQKEYDGAISGEFKNKYKSIEGMIAKKTKEGGLTIKEINEVKRMVYKDLNPFTASGKVKASADDVAFANREIKNFIEDVAQKSGVTEDGMTIKLLNNEFAMADGLRKAIAQREALDASSAIMNFISHSGSPLALGGVVGSGIGPFDKNTTSGWIGNIVVGALVGSAMSSTAVTTKVAGRLRSIPKEQQAKVLTILKKGVQATDTDKDILLQTFSKLDVDLIDDTNLSFSDEIADISSNSVRNTVDNTTTQIDNLTTQVTEQLDNVASPTTDLGSVLKNATDEELKANGFTATMIKQFRKKNPLTKVGTTESATQSIAEKADDVLQTATPLSKVDDALPVGEKMGNTTQSVKSLESADLTTSIKKAKAEGKTFDEFVKSQGDTFYHGTNADFESFDISKIGSQTDDGLFGRGFYFTPNKEMAKSAPRGGNAKNIMEVNIDKSKMLDLKKFKSVQELADHLDMSESALKVDSNGFVRPLQSQINQFTSHIEDLGYKGVYVNRGGLGDEMVVFDPSQIKTITQLRTERDKLSSTTTPALGKPLVKANVSESADNLVGDIKKVGDGYEVSYMRNTEKSPNLGSKFGQDIEPAGQYFSISEGGTKGLPDTYEVGTKTLKKPLVIERKSTDATGRKGELSKKYGGKTGKNLSKAIVADGYDGIITWKDIGGKKYTSESVDLTSFIK